MAEKLDKVWHITEKNGKYIGHYISDLQYDEGIPYVVLEWLNTPEGEIPSIRVPLNPQDLHCLKGKHGVADYLYTRSVVWPKHQ